MASSVSESINQDKNKSWSTVQSLLQDSCRLHSSYSLIVLRVTNSITHNNKKKSRVEMEFNHCLRHFQNNKWHRGLASLAGGKVWIVKCYRDLTTDTKKRRKKWSSGTWVNLRFSDDCERSVVDFTYFLAVSWWAYWDPASAVKYW